MFSRKKKEEKKPEATKPVVRKSNGVPSILASDMNVLGNILSEGTVDIDGVVEGNVKCYHATVRKNGHVKGDVVAEIVHVYGRIQGLIKARNVHFFKGCRAEGVIMHESITIEDGAFVDGRFKRTDKLVLDDGEGESAHAAPLAIGASAAALEASRPAAAGNFDPGSFKSPHFAGQNTPDKTGADDDGMEKNEKEDVRMLENLRLISDVDN